MTRPDRTTFEQLVHTCHAAVFRAARRLVADEAAAADVTQEVFLRVWTGKVQLDSTDNPKAVLVWFAVRQAANGNRASRRREHHEEHAMRVPTDTTTDPAVASERHDLHAHVVQLVAELPSELRLPLLLHHQDELPLAAIGSALALPTSTVHDRIQRGLQRLRQRLSHTGQPCALAALPGLLAGVDLAPAPAGLEHRLLALPSLMPVAVLPKAVLTLLAAGLLVAGMALANGAAGKDPIPTNPAPAVVVHADPQDPAPTARKPAAVPDRRAIPEAQAVSEPAKGAAAPWQATFTGVVHDVGGFPVVGASVQVVAGGGYKPFELGPAATTDARGAFRCAATSDWLRPDHVRVLVREHGRVLLDSGDLAAERPAEAAPLDLVLPPTVAPATEKFDLTVAVRTPEGEPMPGAKAVLYAGTAGAPSLHWRTRTVGEATAGADGRARLQGRGLGRRWLFVDGRPVGRTSTLRAVDLAIGPHSIDAELAAGRELDVVVAGAGGYEPQHGEPWLEHDTTGLWLQPKRRGDAWHFRGLGDGTYTVRYADAARRGIRADAGRVTITAKDPNDPSDVGDHMAELHGELVDATTGEVVEFDPFDVDLHPVLADGSSWAADGVEPPAPAQRAAMGGKRASFHFTGLAPGRWAVVAQVKGFATVCEVFTLAERDVKHGLRVRLPAPATLRGRVVDASGRAVATATVIVVGTGPLADRQIEAWRVHLGRTHSPGDAEPSFAPLRGWTREPGTFALTDVPPDVPLRLVAMHDELGFVVLKVPPLRAGEAANDLTLKLAPR
ncbi:MAG: sigma-70 family RNA polymerase sigma factor [Planctomycetes bacterium]|nr:sigma-70 family RNA polymerase sigma factor [Planctomycetota bacterium]